MTARPKAEADALGVPHDMLAPRGPVLASAVEHARTPEAVARQIAIFGEARVRYAQARGWL